MPGYRTPECRTMRIARGVPGAIASTRAEQPCGILFPSTTRCVLVNGIYVCKTCGWSVAAHIGRPLEGEMETPICEPRI